MLSKEEVEAKARAEYEAHLGKEVEVKAITCYANFSTFDIALDPPAKVRVEKTRTEDVLRWMDEHLDPVWDVTLLQPHPQLENMESFWIYATSYTLDGSTSPGDVIPAGDAVTTG